MPKHKPEIRYELIRILKNISNIEEFESLLETILTPSELKEIAGRLDIITMLTGKFTQRQIAKHLKISINTVSRGAEVVRQLEKKNPKWWKDFKNW